MFRCGPAAVKAVYEQKVDAQYDVRFVCAEVNAEVHTIIVRDGEILSKKVDKHRVGALISTKHPGSMRRQDVTSEYKTVRGKRKNDNRIQKRNVKMLFSYKNLLISHLDKLPSRVKGRGAAGKLF